MNLLTNLAVKKNRFKENSSSLKHEQRN